MVELWVQYGVGETKIMLPLHTLHTKLGYDLCQVIIKAHVLTGDDYVSKVGTKHSALSCFPNTHLGEHPTLCEENIELAEKYLVQVWSGRSRTSSETFDELRLEIYKGSVVKALDNLPPTSSVIRGHLTRSFYVIRNVLTLLDVLQPAGLDPCDYGWEHKSGFLIPKQYLLPMPANILVTCNCAKHCTTRQCKCRTEEKICTEFCHKKNKQCKNNV